MPVYLVNSLRRDSTPVNDAVGRHIAPPDRYQLPEDRGWFVKFDGTTIELSNRLEITGQEKGVASPVGPALVIPVTGYYGRGSTDMWEWLKNRLES